jgi:hypothetical protein
MSTHYIEINKNISHQSNHLLRVVFSCQEKVWYAAKVLMEVIRWLAGLSDTITSPYAPRILKTFRPLKSAKDALCGYSSERLV